MRIALTYDLREDYLAQGYGEEETAEFDQPSTIAALQAAIAHHGHDVERIGNVRALTRALAADRRWDLVFNIAEGLYGFGREAQVPALLEAHGIACTFSDTLVMSVCLHKGIAKDVLRARGIATPASVVIEHAAQCAGVHLAPPLFVKPVAEGTGKGVTPAGIVRRLQDLPAVCTSLIARYRQPVLVETYLPGREFTVAILGNGAEARCLPLVAFDFTTLPCGAPPVYGYEAKWLWDTAEHQLEIYECPARVPDAVARDVERVALAAYRALACRDWCRIDVRLDARGVPNVVELNPLPGILPDPRLNSCFPKAARAAGYGYDGLIQEVVRIAWRRITGRDIGTGADEVIPRPALRVARSA